ncbi:hypothetical protein C8Q76DRAFT_372257 [Earliella scabrosa]|nr:hypothetical protein C8Q76DRAFT_372257 [Earliella scabrosa]
MSHGNPSRWQQARDALAPLAEVTASYDSDGIDIFFLNNEKEGRNLKNAEQVIRLFDSVTPDGRTPIGERLDELLRDYIDLLDERARGPRERRPKPVNFIVLTDGVPTDDPESVIMNAARRLDEGRHLLNTVGIQFVQVGDDPDATAYLQSLDNDLKGVRDIVDTTPYLGGELTVDMIIKIVIGGINRRVDKEGASFLKQEFL